MGPKRSAKIVKFLKILQLFTLNLSDFDLYFNSAWKFKFHQSIYCFWSRAVYVQQTAERVQFELLTSFLVNECRAVNSEDLFVCRKWNRTTYNCAGSFYCFYDLVCRFVYKHMIVRF